MSVYPPENRPNEKSDVPESAQALLARRQPLIIGHRGCGRHAPENTIPSLGLALIAGADLVEVDYQVSKDGQPMVIHDSELDRTTDAIKRWGGRRIRVDSRTATEIQSLDAGSWFDGKYAGTRVPTLAEALDFIRQRGILVIERKSGEASTCIELLRKKGMGRKTVVMSFDWQFLRTYHQLAPQQLLGAVGPAEVLSSELKPCWRKALTEVWLDEVQRTGAQIVVWNRQLSAKALRAAHARNLKVWVYTVNDVRLANKLVRLGVDGLISDDPGLLRAKLSQKKWGQKDVQNSMNSGVVPCHASRLAKLCVTET